jgi:hypothetical protein
MNGAWFWLVEGDGRRNVRISFTALNLSLGEPDVRRGKVKQL